MQSSASVKTLEDVLRETFGLEKFRSKQEDVIRNVMAGRHTLALLPTGYGKSLCYQVPSQVLEGVTIVVSPLIALMQDQLSGMIRRGITNVTLLNSSLDFEERDDRMAGIKAGAFKLIYVAPERFESTRFQQLLASIKVSLLVIDEAHCISQWGHDFRPNYRNISSHLAHIPGATILALTATATPNAQADIVKSLKLDNMEVVKANFDRPNLRLEVRDCRNNYEKDSHVLKLVRSQRSPSIVYTSSRKDAEGVASRLRENGVKAAHYHAGMTRDQRTAAQKSFESDQVSVIVCTVAFGMGIDKANVRRVIHYSLPGSIENYYQEAGRAGRDGAPAVCTLLYQAKDIFTQKFLLDRNYPDGESINDVLRYIKSQSPMAVRRQDILAHVSIEDSALNSALDLMKTLEIIDVASDAGITATSRAQNIQLVPMGILNERKRRDADRLQRMIDYARATRCRRREIVSYFGQQLPDPTCDKCDICSPPLEIHDEESLRGGSPIMSGSQSPRAPRFGSTKLEGNSGAPAKSGGSGSRPRVPGEVELAILKLVELLKGQVGRTTIAQILAGSRAKKITERELHKNEFHGAFAGVGEKDLLSIVDTVVERGEIRVTPGLYPKVLIAPAGKQKIALGS